MSSRTALIGPFQQARARAINEVVNLEDFISKLPPLDVLDLWYAGVIQAGVERLDLVNSKIIDNDIRWKQDASLSPFVSKRVAHKDSPEFASAFALVYQTFQNHFGEGRTGKDQTALFELQAFLMELFLAAHYKQNLVYFSRIPALTELERVLPVDLLLPFKNLILTLENPSPSLPSTRASIAVRDVALYEEIITSKLYAQYKRSHSAFDEGGVSVNGALELVNRQGRLLAEQSPRLLKTKRTAVSLLPITSKIIDTIFGKLPGTLADFFAAALTKWLQDDRRIVIYQFGDLLEITMRARLNELERVKER
jgi:hypothetical protein